MDQNLPLPLRCYFDATNRKDIDAMLAPFSPGATVHDEGASHSGRRAIRAWMDATTRKYGVRVEVTEVDATGDVVRVVAFVCGNFPGSPATLHYVFTLGRDGIDRLEIGA